MIEFTSDIFDKVCNFTYKWIIMSDFLSADRFIHKAREWGWSSICLRYLAMD